MKSRVLDEVGTNNNYSVISVKSGKELQAMRIGGQCLAKVMVGMLEEVMPGTQLSRIEEKADLIIRKLGGRASFKMVKGYHWATCLNVNQGVVHGIPGRYRLKESDLLSLDVGFYYRGFHTDMARTIEVRSRKDEVGRTKLEGRSGENETQRFLNAGRAALAKAIQVTKADNRVGHISKTIEKEIRKNGFFPVKNLTGHGIGRQLHEEPAIPCFLTGGLAQTTLLKEGMVLAIEVIYARKETEIVVKQDGWTIETLNQSPAALFEDTVIVHRHHAENITALPGDFT